MIKANKEGQRKTPILRFKGFTDDWEQRKLQNQVQFFSGLTYSPNDVKSVGTFVIRSSNIKDNTLVSADNVYVNPNIANSEPVKKDDVIMVVRNGSKSLIGKHALVTRKINNTVIGAFMTGIRSSTPYFLDALLDTINFKKEIYENLGATINQITVVNLRKMTFKVPNESEKFKIGNLFKKLNYLLVLYERKYQLYLLQFQKLQRVIFDNSDDFISLSSLIEIKTGNRNSQDNVKNGKYVFFDRSTEIKKLNEFDFDEEAIIIPGEGTKFAPKYVNGKYALHQRSYSLYNFSQEIDSKYLYYFLMTQSNTLLRYSVGTTVPSLRVSTFDHIKVPMYSKELQMKYASTFDSLEKLLSQIKEKTNILRSLKQFLLQVLFL